MIYLSLTGYPTISLIKQSKGKYIISYKKKTVTYNLCYCIRSRKREYQDLPERACCLSAIRQTPKPPPAHGPQQAGLSLIVNNVEQLAAHSESCTDTLSTWYYPYI
jgi:hypothetical protein